MKKCQMPNPKVISPPAISVALEMPNNAEFALSGLTTSDPWAKDEHPIAARRNKREAISRFDPLIRFLPFWMPLDLLSSSSSSLFSFCSAPSRVDSRHLCFVFNGGNRQENDADCQC
jgi:hypothetical protein